MFYLSSTFRFAVSVTASLILFGCADMGARMKQMDTRIKQLIGSSDTSKPIANSLEEMPDDAAMVTVAIQKKITGTGQGQAQNVRFSSNSKAGLAQKCSIQEGFVHTGTQLYLYETKHDTPSDKKISGRLDFEGPLGRRASVRYDVHYRTSENGVLIEEILVLPVYSRFPEPIMFVVPAEVLPVTADGYPQEYSKLLQFIGKLAVHSAKPASVSMKKRDYVIFVFFLDQVSSSSNLKVKISDQFAGMNGYEKSTMYMDFDGWRAALLPCRFTLFGNSASPPIYVKAVFSPGKEVVFLRRTPKLVGLFKLSG
jgi:hypothetical protein